MANNQLKPTKYRVFSSPDKEHPVHTVMDMEGRVVCTCDREYNAKIIWKLLEKFT